MRTDEAEAYASTASTGEGGRNLPGTGAGAEVRTAAVGRTKPGTPRLMEAVVERSNMLCAYERVVKNQGAPGVDGLTVAAFKPWLVSHWASVRQALLAGEYIPEAVRKVEIPKPQGGVRTLGIPTVLDRLIQQALHQVLQPLFEPEFSGSSYGFRPGRNAHQAVKAARGYVAEGRRWVVDLDLEKFFDRVNHDVLMARVVRKVKDERVLKLIRRYLEAGLMEGGVVSARTEGTPQGGPLSPLLSNILLTDLDRELEKRGYRFCRYADDCNIYVGCKRSGERGMTGHRKPKLKIAQPSVERFAEKIRQTLRRARGRGLKQVFEQLNPVLRGWVAYFRLTEVKGVLAELDGWIRHASGSVQTTLSKLPRPHDLCTPTLLLSGQSR